MIYGFTTNQAAKLTRLSYSQVDYWDRSALVKPSLRAATGKGTDRRYSFSDVMALRIAGDLRRAGVSGQALRKVVSELRSRSGLELDQPLASPYLVTDGRDVYKRRGDELLSLLRQPGQGCFLFVLDISAAVEELRAEVVKLRAA